MNKPLIVILLKDGAIIEVVSEQSGLQYRVIDIITTSEPPCLIDKQSQPVFRIPSIKHYIQTETEPYKR